MKALRKTINYIALQFHELSDDEKELVEKAKAATLSTYSPYSHFGVGAAVRLGNGEVVTGANQENVAFPSGLCAERTALFAAGASFPDQKVTKIAIAARHAGSIIESPITPCGACCQVMLESEKRAGAPLTIYLHGKNVTYKLTGVQSLLPFSFVSFEGE